MSIRKVKLKVTAQKMVCSDNPSSLTARVSVVKEVGGRGLE